MGFFTIIKRAVRRHIYYNKVYTSYKIVQIVLLLWTEYIV